MEKLKRINPSEIKLNIRFSAPVFFDDGRFMFLAAGRTAKAYHLEALKKWEIPFLLTAGHVLQEDEVLEDGELEEISDLEEL